MLATRTRKTAGASRAISASTAPVVNAARREHAVLTTGLALCPHAELLAVTSVAAKGSPNIQLFKYEQAAQDNILGGSNQVTAAPAQQSLSVPFSIYASSWKQCTLAVAGEGANVAVFSQLGGAGGADSVKLETTCAFNLTDIVFSDKNAAHRSNDSLEFTPNSDNVIRKLDLASDAATLLTAQAKKLLLINTETQDILASDSKFSPASITHVAHQDAEPRAVACGNETGAIFLFDAARGFAKPTLVFENAHEPGTAVETVEFNPYVPYCFASSGEDAVVKVWDVRNPSRPFIVADPQYGHTQTVSAMCWSPHYMNQLVTCSFDKSVKFWCLSSRSTIDDAAASSSSSGSKGSPSSFVCRHFGERQVSETFGIVQEYPNTFFAVSHHGELFSMRLHDELLDSVANYKYNADQYQNELCIEHELHTRHIETAYRDFAVHVAETSQNSIFENLDAYNSLYSLLKPPAKPEADQLLEKHAWIDYLGVPPAYFDIFEKFKTSKDLDVVNGYMQLVNLLNKYNTMDVIKNQKSYVKSAERNPALYTELLFKEAIQHVQIQGQAEALQFALSYLEVLQDSSTSTISQLAKAHPHLSEMLYYLLFPTIFDSKMWIAPGGIRLADMKDLKAKHIVRSLVADRRKPDDRDGITKEFEAQGIRFDSTLEKMKLYADPYVLPDDLDSFVLMIRTELSILKTLQKQKTLTPQFYADIQAMFFTGEGVLPITGSFAGARSCQLSMKSISSFTTLVLLETMLESKRFEMYFTNASYFIGAYITNDIATILATQMADVAVPRYAANTDTSADVSKARDAVLAAIRISNSVTPIIIAAASGGDLQKVLRGGYEALVKYVGKLGDVLISALDRIGNGQPKRETIQQLIAVVSDSTRGMAGQNAKTNRLSSAAPGQAAVASALIEMVYSLLEKLNKALAECN